MTSIGQSVEVDRGFAASAASAASAAWPRSWLIRRALVAADIAGLIVAFGLSEALYGSLTGRQRFDTSAEAALFLLTLPVWVLVAKLYGLYDRDEPRTDQRTSDDLVGVFHLATVGTWIVITGSRITHVANPDLLRITVFWALAITSIMLTRSVARALCRRHSSFIQNTLVVGTGPEGRLIARKLEQNPEFGLRVVGFVDREAGVRVDGHLGSQVVGTLSDLPRLIRERDVGRVVMGFTGDGHEELLRQIRELNARGIQVDVIPRFHDLMGPEVDVYTAGGITLWSLRPFRLSRSSRAMKRAVDVAVSIVGLCLLAPVFVVTAALIKLDSRGPVFFRQERVRDQQHTFRIWKFRTMVTDAEVRKDEFAHLNVHAQDGGDAKMFKVEKDPRVTRIGRVLRRFSVDEFPQLLNVLAGEMSLVGPRPLIPKEHLHVTEWRRRRLDVKPGMTGLWQVNGRSDLAFEEMVSLDYRYVTNWTLKGDLSLIVNTIPEIFRGKAAAI